MEGRSSHRRSQKELGPFDEPGSMISERINACLSEHDELGEAVLVDIEAHREVACVPVDTDAL